MQPWLDRYPGMTMGQWGFHMDRTNTWFEQSTAWLKYVARCQYLLQQGRFVADVAYFCGESAPVERKDTDPPLPRGYDQDSVNADVLMQATVKDGRIVLPSGMSYAVLVLPKTDRMTPPLAARIRDLVKDGATVLGPKPVQSPSLQDYPKCDEQVHAIGDEMWGTDAKGASEHDFGKGKVYSEHSLAEVLTAASVKPDFEVPTDSRARLVFIHRLAGDDDIYFVSNQQNGFVQTQCTFRVSGKVPQLWHPDSGVIERAPVYSEADGRTTVLLQFDPVGSVFVIFRKGDAPAEHPVDVAAVDRADECARAPGSSSSTQPTKPPTAQGSVDLTDDLKAMIKSGIDRIAVNNQTFGQDPAVNHGKQLRAVHARGQAS